MKETTPQRLVWAIGMYIVAAFFYLYEFLLRVVLMPMQGQLERDFNINYTEYSYLSAAYYWSYAFLQIPVGALMDKIGPRRLLTFAILLCAVSTLLFSITTSFELAWLARFMIGAGSAFAFISCLKITVIWFPGAWFPILSSLTLAMGTLGAVVGAAPIAKCLEFMDWRYLMQIIGSVGLLTGVVAWYVIRDHNPGQMHLTSTKVGFWECLKHVVTRPENWLVGMYAFLATAPTDAFGGTWGALLLRDTQGLTEVSANFAASLIFLGIVFGSPLMGWGTGYLRSRRKPMMIGAFVSGVLLLALLYAPGLSAGAIYALCFAYGLFGSYILCFVVAQDINKPVYVGTTVGFINCMSMLGSALLINTLGTLMDVVKTDGDIYTAAHYQTVFIIIPLFYAISAFVVLPLMKESFGRKIQ